MHIWVRLVSCIILSIAGYYSLFQLKTTNIIIIYIRNNVCLASGVFGLLMFVLSLFLIIIPLHHKRPKKDMPIEMICDSRGNTVNDLEFHKTDYPGFSLSYEQDNIKCYIDDTATIIFTTMVHPYASTNNPQINHYIKICFLASLICSIIFGIVIGKDPLNFFRLENIEEQQIITEPPNTSSNPDIVLKTVEIGNSYVPIEAGKITRVKFVAPSAGTYVFSSVGNDDTYGYLYNSATSTREISSNDDYENNRNFRIEYYLSANQAIYVGVKYYSADMNGTINLSILKKTTTTPTPSHSPTPQIVTVNTGTNHIYVSAGQISRALFIAPTAGTYVFTSIGSDDTYGYLYSSATSTTEIRSDDDGGTDHNFKIEYSMSTKQRIYLGVRYYSSDKSGTITLRISKQTEQSKSWPVGAVCRVVVRSGNARTGPGTDYSIAGSIYSDNRFTVLDYQLGNTGKDWYKINLNGTTCWISSGLVEVGGHREGTINGVPIQ